MTISRTRSAPTATAIVMLGLLIPASPARAHDDLVVDLAVPSAGDLGTYTGAVQIALGEVRDAVYAESPSHLGMGPEAMFKIETGGSRADFVRQGLGEAFRRIGLLPEGDASSAHVMDVRILRDRLYAHQTEGRCRLRAELFLQCTFRLNETVVDRILACGNAETHAQFASREKIRKTYQIGFNDAVHKILNSRALARILGGGWKPAPSPEQSGEYNTTRIHRDEFYGPTDLIQEEVEKASKAIQKAGPFTHVVLPDFQLEEVKGKKEDDLHDVQVARAIVPEKIREHLNAFFPGAFEKIDRADSTSGPGTLVVDGRLDKFRVGSYTARKWVAGGAGADKLVGQVSIKDASGKTLAGFPIVTANWGSVWQLKRGQIRDMVDQVARDIAYFLVATAVPAYKPPDDLEILFDAIPYPLKPTQRPPVR